MLDTKILIGDVVELSPAKYSTIDNFELEKCTVLKMEDDGSRIMVVFNKDSQQVESFFDKNSTVDWFASRYVTDLERDYKIIEVTDTQDSNTNQRVTLVKMARVNKLVKRTLDGVILEGNVEENDLENFLFTDYNNNDLLAYQGTINRISFANYRQRNVVINNNQSLKVWQPRFNMTDVMNIFTKTNVA